jgi:hypothetical protein
MATQGDIECFVEDRMDWDDARCNLLGANTCLYSTREKAITALDGMIREEVDSENEWRDEPKLVVTRVEGPATGEPTEGVYECFWNDQDGVTWAFGQVVARNLDVHYV